MYFLLAVTTLLLSLYYYFTRTFDYWKKRNVVGPKPLPFFGNIIDSVLRREHLIMTLKKIYPAYPNEKVVGLYRMTTPCLMLRDLDIIKHVLIKDFDLFVDRGISFSEEGLGQNMFHADGDKWRVLRHRFTPLFTSGKLKNMLYLMTDRGDKVIDYIGQIYDKQTELPMHLLLQKFTIGSITACAFGVDLDDEMMQTLENFDKIMFVTNYGVELDMMYPGILKKFNSSLFPKNIRTFFYDLTKSVIKQRGGMPTNRKDFMDLILELRQNKTIESYKRNDNEDVKTLEVTDSIIAAQTFVFYAAGYETSASTMTHLFYELAKNPDVQDKLITEIKEVLKGHNGEITYESLNDMTYLHQVFDETLRKYPIADVILRKAQVDYKLPGTDITLEKGTSVVLSTWGIHHDPKYYPNPEKFDPENFSTENEKKRHPCAYLPFGTGPRNCIGMRFAKLQSQVFIVKFLSKYRVEPSKSTPSEIKYDPMRVLLYSQGGLYLKVVRRDY
ncbi:PREDICTED: cytochrome P450 6B5-like [Papilio xuthus]|uniref:unspecific monooxygenase n=1 Tax=Papilio xuthus TaxID=66420 RepID=A0AAJ6ZKC1_PAPXU